MCALQFIPQQRCGALAKNCLCNAYLTPRLANPQELTTPPRSRAGGFAWHGDSVTHPSSTPASTSNPAPPIARLDPRARVLADILEQHPIMPPSRGSKLA